MSQLQALYRLQQIDTGIDTRRQRYRKLSAALENDATLTNARQQAASLEAELRPQEARVKDLNLEIKSTITQTEQLTKRLYDGSVGNPKELEEMQDKVAELKRQRARLEDTLLETMIRVEELQASFQAAGEQLETVEQTWDTDHASMHDERQRIKREARQLKAEREEAVAAISADNLALYDELRRTRHGQAVATLEGESCTACAVAQTSNIVQKVRQRQEITVCVGCGRILVVI